MTKLSKQLLIAVCTIVAGVAAFLLYLAVTGHGDDGQSFGLLDWVIGGALIGPGFGLLIQWRKARGR